MRWGRWLIGMTVCLIGAGCSNPKPNGQQVFAETGCARCHETDGRGGAMGPALVALKEKWTADELDRFLQNPPKYLEKNPRLEKVREAYFTPMPRLNIPSDRRKILVDYLLSPKNNQRPDS